MRIEELKTPCYVIDEKQLKKNLSILQKVEKDTGCKILLAQKAFSCFYEYPLIGQYISGTTASGLFEARLGKEEMGKENHVFAPAYKEEDVKELVKICDHMVFNSFSQLEKYKTLCKEIIILEKTKYAKIDCQTGVEPHFPLPGFIVRCFVQLKTQNKIGQRAEKQQKQKPPVPKTVKSITCNQQKGITQGNCTVKNQPVEQKDYRHENRKVKGIEKHILLYLLSIRRKTTKG
jgi:hypothetical protein